MKITPQHYVDNVKFLAEIKAYQKACRIAKEKKREAPRMNEYLGECLLKIAQHLSFKPNFVNYTFRDDMISDGIENCLVYAHNFNPEKSSNPFGYFTQVIFYAFIRRIQREKKQTYIKYKLIERAMVDGSLSTNPEGGPKPISDSTYLNLDNIQDFLTRYDEYSVKRKERRRVTKRKGSPT